ncbi:MAG: hypothetical protein COU47_00620 [Candidatus Niyogibacteria bacterium CG10_big_fil_rev_8_21_14_0_10_46_36]|uniref:Glycosyl transferase family 1 domain-containing protein n=1 Tax=Candidatus Niyogibacteria bacterium CG10_big_fil_rev_8_21_14_0_10_46_36 TaxID=1974726 RepID=A0A2H0TEF0_9BACT|nr:MAG: hypothetical protein COU47_00620 [Candidatus Niyogibacteria bacterium CG10_big_fil_rev_8_21_14_0_10_46_36]
MKQRVLIFSTAYLPLVGGAELAIKEITDRMPEYDFFMITTRFSRAHKKHERVGSIEVYRVGWGVLPFFDKLCSPVLGALRARSLVKEQPFSLFWSMMVSFTSMSPFLLKVLGLHRKTPVLLTLQEGDSEAHLTYRYGGLMFLMWKMALRLADRIQVISNYLKSLAEKRGARVPIDVVPNGVAYTHFSRQYAPQELDALKRALGKGKEDVYVITTSRLVLKNAVDDGIRALERLPHRVKFLVLGKGPLERDLKKLATNLHVAERVFFLGEISHADMPKYLRIADIYIRPSLSEGLGNSFLEAMAAEVPVIATPVGGIPDFLTDGVTGLFCNVRNPKSIAMQAERLMRDNALRDSIIQNAKRMVEERYNWDTSIAGKMKIIFKELIHGHQW